MASTDTSLLQTVEVLKRPGQSLGFYIREGNGSDRSDGVFISRIAAASVVEQNGLLHVGDEILTVNSVTVKKMSLDDVVILMSIPKRLVLNIRRRPASKNASCPSLAAIEQQPVYVPRNTTRSTSATHLHEKNNTYMNLSPYELRDSYTSDSELGYQTPASRRRRKTNYSSDSEKNYSDGSVLYSTVRHYSKPQRNDYTSDSELVYGAETGKDGTVEEDWVRKLDHLQSELQAVLTSSSNTIPVQNSASKRTSSSNGAEEETYTSAEYWSWASLRRNSKYNSVPKRTPQRKWPSRPEGEGQCKSLQLGRKPLKIRLEEFNIIKCDEARRKSVTNNSVYTGLLSTHLFSAHGLKSARTVLRDLYCVLQLDGAHVARTMIRTGAINFDWDEKFDMEADKSRNFFVHIYSWDPNTRHRLCFTASLPLYALLTGSSKDIHKVALRLEPKGTLYMQVQFTDASVLYQRTLRHTNLFGMPIDSVLRREDTPIPYIVSKCVAEVEKRGLEHAGIYRLCGSAIRKSQLKAEFEKCSKTVDLSPQSVSDINVVTGILKDYLRHLPEPLFTNALCRMLLDALSVRLPSDPAGNAQLMLSILDCLPKSNQLTINLILDHLRHVTSKSDINKMTPGALASIFGPILLCPSPSTVPDAASNLRQYSQVLEYLLQIWPHEKSGCVTRESSADSVRPAPTGGEAETSSAK